MHKWLEKGTDAAYNGWLLYYSSHCLQVYRSSRGDFSITPEMAGIVYDFDQIQFTNLNKCILIQNICKIFNFYTNN